MAAAQFARDFVAFQGHVPSLEEPTIMVANDTDSLLQFPCEFPIKAFGRNEGDFCGLVLEILRRHVTETDLGVVEQRASSGGQYLAVTVTIVASSRAQLDAVYRDLSGHERVEIAL